MKTYILAAWLVALCNLAATGAEIALTPISASGVHTIVGDEIILEGGGQRVFLEIFLAGWDPDLDGSPQLRGWQAVIDSSGYISGLQGTLAPAVEACTTDGDCRAAFGGACSLTGGACVQDADCPFPFPIEFCGGPKCDFPPGGGLFCEPGFILTGRSDYVFLTVDNLPVVDLATPNFRFGGATFFTFATDPGIPQYGGTLVLDVPVGAIGTFTVGFIAVDSFMQDANLNAITPLALIPVRITITCQTNVDCDDGNACTNDVCNLDGTCSNDNNFNDLLFCCNPVNGTLTTIDDANDCTEDVCNPADGSVAHPPLPAGTMCGDPTNTECNHADTCDAMGVCQDNVQPAGTFCGDPTASECNNPDTCDGAGTCQPNFVAGGTLCGDPSNTDCTGPDMCDGSGTCQPNDAPDGAVCNDGAFCTEGETCVAGECGGGTPLDCNDGLDCTADACNENTDQCDNDLLLGRCLINGVCFLSGDLNPANDCEACDPVLSPSNFSPRPAGSACDDGDACTGTGRKGIGVDSCDGAGICVGILDPECNDDCAFAVEVFEGTNTGNNDNRAADTAEASCQPDSNNDVWFVFTATCNGTVFASTTGSQFIPSNDPVLSVYDACPGAGSVEIACDDDSGVGLQAALTFTATTATMYWFRVAGFENNTGNIVLNISTVNDCLINGVCHPEGSINPDNDCEVCIPAISTTSWSPRPEGSPCGDPNDTECDSPDACDGAGVCESNPKPDGTACSDDGNECTFDVCGGGLCTHPPRPVGTACGDNIDTECDNPDTCDGTGLCLDNFEPLGTPCGDPISDQCNNPDICDGAGLCDNNFVADGTPCDDEDICTGADACETGVCVGSPIPEAPIVRAFGSRYLAVTPQPAGSPAPVALLLTSPTWPCLVKYIGATGFLVNDPVVQLPDEWGTIFVRGVDIAPSSTYEIQAECGEFLSPAGSDTTALWGDIVGFFDGSQWTPPDGAVNILDVLSIVERFLNAATAPQLERADLWPCTPDMIVNILDVLMDVDALLGVPYPCPSPCPP